MQSHRKLNAQTLPVTSEPKSAPDHGPILLSAAEIKLVSGGLPKTFWAPEVQINLLPKTYW